MACQADLAEMFGAGSVPSDCDEGGTLSAGPGEKLEGRVDAVEGDGLMPSGLDSGCQLANRQFVALVLD